MGKLFSGSQVLVPKVACKIIRSKANQWLNRTQKSVAAFSGYGPGRIHWRVLSAVHGAG
jgi:hypothetical protein